MTTSLLVGMLMASAYLTPPAPPAPLIVAHRGASYDAPENTLAAFKLAWEQGADAIEGDYRLTKDGQIVCLHDANAKRTAGVELEVAKATSAELRALDFGKGKGPRWAGERIPTLDEVLATVPAGKGVYLELKIGPAILPPLKEALAKSRLQPTQVTLISFDAAVLAQAKQQLPQIRAFWLTDYQQDQDTKAWSPTQPDILSMLQRTSADGLGSRAHERLDAPFIQALQARHLGLNIWTVDDPEVAAKYLRLGATSITTNRPGWLREQLRRR